MLSTGLHFASESTDSLEFNRIDLADVRSLLIKNGAILGAMSVSQCHLLSRGLDGLDKVNAFSSLPLGLLSNGLFIQASPEDRC